MKITRKRKERLDKERANFVATVERLEREKKADYLLKIREGRRKKGAIERETNAYSYGFRAMAEPELLEKRHMYEGMKKIAEGNSNELLVHHCEDMLMEINKWLKKKG